ncbi:XisI protein [filamentous cyanobacterium LEGE 11480]|uniref:XisI protein n=1 Tax=Romeriopsis navalis LEGE 11480 TaxID=2777977 RepID=A0A928Z4I8_9CYAN|nr:XisI protein [Romeriopsis navalis]MBE9032671.1 XisI protein [Romeriopsis navalis LEGE 11480]
MDKLGHYRQCLQAFLTQYAKYGAQTADMETQLIFDTANDHYLLIRTGWEKVHRVHACIFHFDIKGDKIWVQENNTDIEVDKELEALGISKHELVIGFHHPSMREYSEYAAS